MMERNWLLGSPQDTGSKEPANLDEERTYCYQGYDDDEHCNQGHILLDYRNAPEEISG